MKALFHTTAKRSKAQSMVEFALILPVLLLLLFGIMEFGRLLLFYTGVVTASREAARYGSAAGDVGGGLPHFKDCDGIRKAARRVGMLATIRDENINISYDHGPGTDVFIYSCPPPEFDSVGCVVCLGDRIRVEVISQFEPIVPLVNLSSIPVSSVNYRSIMMDIPIEGTPPTPYPSHTPMPGPSPTPSRTPQPTNTPTITLTPSPTPTDTPTPTNTPTRTNTPLGAPTETSTSTATPTRTPTNTSTPTLTPTPTATPNCRIGNGGLTFAKRTVGQSEYGYVAWSLQNLEPDDMVLLTQLTVRWPFTSPPIKLFQSELDSTVIWTDVGKNPTVYTIMYAGLTSDRLFNVNSGRTLRALFSKNLVPGTYQLTATFENYTTHQTCTAFVSSNLSTLP